MMFSILSKYWFGNESIISYSAPSQSNFKSLHESILLISKILSNEIDSTVTNSLFFSNIL